MNGRPLTALTIVDTSQPSTNTLPLNGSAQMPLPRNAVLGPNFWNVDLALSRTLPVVAAHTLELRLEAFNLFNTFNWGDPADPAAAGGAIATLNSPQFGRILTQAGSPRIIQLGMKYSF